MHAVAQWWMGILVVFVFIKRLAVTMRQLLRYLSTVRYNQGTIFKLAVFAIDRAPDRVVHLSTRRKASRRIVEFAVTAGYSPCGHLNSMKLPYQNIQ